MNREKKNWTREEKIYLKEHWGKVQLSSLSKHLGRTELGIRLKATRMGLGYRRDFDGNPSFCELLTAMGIKGGYSWYKQKFIKMGMPVYQSNPRAGVSRITKIKMDDFWKWAEKHPTLFPWDKLEKNTFGVEPAWVDKYRHITYGYKPKNKFWTPIEDNILRVITKDKNATYRDLTKRLPNRTALAVKKRLLALGLRLPKAEPDTPWNEVEKQKVIEMYSMGYDYQQIAIEMNRSEGSVRGKIWHTLNPDCYKRKNRRENTRRRLEKNEKLLCAHGALR